MRSALLIAWLVASAPLDVSGLPPTYFLLQGDPNAAEANLSEIGSYLESNAQLRKELEELLEPPLDLGGRTAAELVREGRDTR